MSRQTPDPDKISPPTAIPPDAPDTQTEEEDKEIKRRKALTAGERADQSNSTLIGTLNAHIDFHKDDSQKWEEHAKNLQSRLLLEKDKEISLVAENSRLKEIAHSLTFFSWLAYLTTVIGAISVGVAGSVPGLGDIAKAGFAWFGVGLTLVGLVCATFASFKGKRANEPELPKRE